MPFLPLDFSLEAYLISNNKEICDEAPQACLWKEPQSPAAFPYLPSVYNTENSIYL